jgi:probable HAF family extracellular repeat protein
VNSRQSPIHCAILTVLSCITLQPARAQEYTVTDLGATGLTNTTWAINATGQVVGYSRLSDGHGNQHHEGFFYDGTSIDYLGVSGNGPSNDLLGINDLGEAVGKSWAADGEALLRRVNGSVQRLGTLSGSRSYARAINNTSQVVGSSKLAGDLESRPFVWEDGVMTALPLMGGGQGAANWINNAGQIVGGSTTDTSGLQQFAVLWEEGTVTRLPPFNGYSHIAGYIHDNGDIVGSVKIPDDTDFITRAAIWRDGQVQILGTLADGTPAEPFATSWASGINAQGVVVGMSVNELNQLVPFVYRDGEMAQLDHLIAGGWLGVWVGDGSINEVGQIAMQATAPGGGSHAVLLTPATPPDCLADFDGDGSIDTLDVLAFLNAWAAGDGSADINGDGTVNTQDVLAFLNLWNAGC